MKKLLTLLVLFVTAVTLNGQVFTEYFENATAGMNLEDYNDWYVSFKASEQNGVSPIIEDEALFYDGYIGSDIGKVALLDSLIGQESATQRISTRVVTFGDDTLNLPAAGGKMYAAFIVEILPNSWGSFRDFFTWEASSGSNFSRGRVFAKVGNDNTDLQFGVSKNSSSTGTIVESEVFSGFEGTYYLLVCAYEVVEGDANDVIHLYINPDPSLSEAEQTVVISSVDTQSDYGGQDIKINLRQRGVGAKVGGIRVGTNWEEVLLGPTSVAVTGVTLDQATLELNAGATGTLVATVAPEDATDPSVTWSSDNEAVATVVDGVVTAVAEGTATITVTTVDGGFTATCDVTVTPAAMVTVTFNVDMSAQAVNSGDYWLLPTDVVYVTGSFNGWNEPGTGASILMSDENLDNIWTATLETDANQTFEYKYFLNTGWNNGDGFTNAHPDNNREAVVGDTNLELNDTWGAIVNKPIGISDFETKGFSLYPNPVSGVLNVKVADVNTRNIEIYNVLGALVLSESVDGRSHVLINTSDIAKGIYYVKINNNSGSHIEQLIVK